MRKNLQIKKIFVSLYCNQKTNNVMKTSNIINIVYNKTLGSFFFETYYLGKVWNFYYNGNIEKAISKVLRENVDSALQIEEFREVNPECSSCSLKYRICDNAYLKYHLVRIIKLYYASKRDVNFVSEFIDSSKFFTINKKYSAFTIRYDKKNVE